MCDGANNYTEQIWEVLKDIREKYEWNSQCKIIQLIDSPGVTIALDSNGRIWESENGIWKQIKGPDLDKREK